MKIASFFFLVLFLITSPASAQPRKPSTIAELAVYRGPDREQILYAGAKAEGKLIWYTSLAGDSYKEMVKAFETKYAGVKVESYRAAGAELVTRLEEEGKARRNIADTIETTEGSLIFLRDDKLLRPYDSPHLDRYPEDGKERADKNTVYWALARESYIGLTYNKTLVPKEAVPKNFDGLLHPELKGKMGISIGQTSDKIIGAMIKTRGEEFVRTGRMGADGLGSDQRGQCRDRRQPAASTRRFTHGGFPFESGRTKSAGEILLRQRRQRLRFQEMASGAWPHDGTIREGAGALG
jgi:extracellular solute-binding protein